MHKVHSHFDLALSRVEPFTLKYCRNMWSVSMCSSTILVQHLLPAADRYSLDWLKLLCEAKLCEEITADTAATTLAIAEQHNCSQLEVACLRYGAMPGHLGGACCP